MSNTKRFSRRAVVAAAGSAVLTGGILAATGGSAGAAPGGNPYSPAAGHPYRHGVVPTVAQQRKMAAYARSHSPGSSSSTLSYGGGPIGVTDGQPKVYLVFWGSQWGSQGTDSHGNLTFSNDQAGAAPYLQQLFKGLGTGGELWSGTMTQYCDGSVSLGATTCPSGSTLVGYPTGGALAGVWYDNSAAEPSTATGEQIAAEAVTAAGHFLNTTATSNRSVQYDIVSAPGLDPDNYLSPVNGYCAWHDWNGDTTLSGGAAPSLYGDVAFTNMPYLLDAGASCGENFVNSGSAGTLDGFSIVNGHEYAETVTDQEPGSGWYNFSTGNENGDECAWLGSGPGAAADVTMGNGSYAMQSTWSNDTNSCAISHPIVTASTGGGGGSATVAVNSPGDQSTKRNTAVTLTMTATDTSGATSFSWTATGLPRGLSINAGTGVISGTTSKFTGNYSVTVKASDSTGATGSASFTWTITR